MSLINDRKKLEKLYVEEKKSLREIGELTGFSGQAVLLWLKKHGIARRTISEAMMLKTPKLMKNANS